MPRPRPGPVARRRGPGLGAAVVVLVAAGLLAPAVPQAEATAPGAPVVEDVDGEPSVEAAPTLPRALPGPAALRRLEDRVAEAALLNGLDEPAFRDLLEDPATRLDEDARVYYVDAPAPAVGAGPPVARGPYPADQTFLLHSKPGAQRTILIDVDGARVAGSEWNGSALPDGDHPAWDPAGDGPSFTGAELDLVQSVWQRVAEDFAPFDVDVTTQDPGPDALTRSGPADLRFGTRALVTPSTTAHQALCRRECGGVAFLGVFDAPGVAERYQPAWVFPQALGPNSAKYVAEAVSHEVGHNLGLDHDGTASAGYYGGHGSWGPLMGGPFGTPITQWSKGDYAGATVTEDDVAVITAGTLGARSDEAGGTVAAAAPWPAEGATSYVTTRDDVDVHDLGTCSGDVTVTATTAPTSPNLDVRLRLLDATGAPVATADPPSARASADRASGLSASVTTSLPAGRWFAEVDGVGNGTPTTGYDDYGSLGAYTLTRSGCAGATTRPPSAPQGLTGTAAADGRAVSLAWTAPADAGSSPVTGYSVERPGAGTVSTSSTAVTVTGLQPGTTTTFTVRATSADGAGAPAVVSVTTPSAPGAPTALSGAQDVGAGTATLAWGEPSGDGGSAITGYEVRVDDGPWVVTTAGARSHTFSGLGGGTHLLAVRAVNAVGAGVPAETSVQPAATPPSVVTGLGHAVRGTTAVVTWGPPADDGGRAVVGYDVGVAGTTYRVPGQGITLAGLRRGTAYPVSVRAVNAAGAGPARRLVVRVPAAPAVTRPGAPHGLVAASGARGRPVTAGVRWRAPSRTGGAAITGYQVLARRLGRTGRVVRTVPSRVLPPRSRSASLRLPAGRYRFVVRARNRAGWSPVSRTSAAVTAR